MKQISFKAIEKKLEKKNLELMEIRESRRKLDDKEKEICAAIDKLQNQKVEVIFEQVKKEIKSENLDISSESIMPMLEALRNNQQILQTVQPNKEVSKISESKIKANDILSEEKSEMELIENEEEDFENSYEEKKLCANFEWKYYSNRLYYKKLI